MAYFIHGLDTIQFVTGVRDNLKELMEQGLQTKEYTVEGNNFRKDQVFTVEKLWNECTDFLIKEKLRLGSGRFTGNFFV